MPSAVKVVKAKSASLQGMRAWHTRARNLPPVPHPFWANLLTIHAFCKLGLSLSYHLKEFLSLSLDFFSLWAHIFPYTYRGQDIKQTNTFWTWNYPRQGGTKIKAASTIVPAAILHYTITIKEEAKGNGIRRFSEKYNQRWLKLRQRPRRVRWDRY